MSIIRGKVICDLFTGLFVTTKLSKESFYLETLNRQVKMDMDNFGPSDYSLFCNFGNGDIQVNGNIAAQIRQLLIQNFELINSDFTQTDTASSVNFRNVDVKNYDYRGDMSGMVDWFRGEILFTHIPIPTGKVLSIEPDGSVEYEAVKSAFVRGSHESSLKVKSSMIDSSGMAQTLLIDGNISKFVQGHNVFGSLNLNSLLLKSFSKLVDYLQLEKELLFSEISLYKTKSLIEAGDYLVKMLDINFLYDLENDASVEAWLHAAEMNARCRSGRSNRKKGTVYIQKNSRRWAVKFYNKWQEINSKDRKHRLKPEFKDSGLDKFIKGKLRAEVRLMSLELSDLGLTLGKQFTPQKLSDLFNHYLGYVQMKPNVTLVDQQLLKLPRVVQGSYQHWREGKNLKELLPKASFYRHRKILSNYGVDISFPPVDGGIPNNVVPMMRVLEAKPISNPDWAYKANLIAS